MTGVHHAKPKSTFRQEGQRTQFAPYLQIQIGFAIVRSTSRQRKAGATETTGRSSGAERGGPAVATAGPLEN